MEYVTSADETTIGFSVTGTGPPLVLVHGGMGDRTRWDPLIEHLDDHFTICAMDRRGRGGSSDGTDYALEREYDDVVALARTIDGPVNIYGHSYGVYLALEAAPKIDNLNRLVLYEGALPDGTALWPGELLDQLEHLGDNGPPGEAISLFGRVALQMSDEDIDRYRSHHSWPAVVATEPTIARELRAQNDYVLDREHASVVDVPTLLLVGGESLSIFTDSVDKMHATLPSSQVKVLEGQAHLADVTAPEMDASAPTEFLSQEQSRSFERIERWST